MKVLISNAAGFEAGRLFGAFPGRMGHLHNPDRIAEPPASPWALDNGVFGAWQKGVEWDEEPFFAFLERFGFLKPEWVVVPDSVADRDGTLRMWQKYSPVLQTMGMRLAFVAQDGMKPADVPVDAAVVFVGGSTSWKWRSLPMWTANFPRVHVGRVNTYKLLWAAHRVGAESCDGTGWFRGDKKQLAGLWEYLKESQRGDPSQQDFSDSVEEWFYPSL